MVKDNSLETNNYEKKVTDQKLTESYKKSKSIVETTNKNPQSDSETSTAINDTHHLEKIKLLYEFQYNSIKEASGVLEKGISFFLLIIAALTSYIISSKEKETIDLELQLKLIAGAIITTVFVTVCVSAIAWGLFMGLKNLKQTLKFATQNVWNKTSIEKFINRGTYTTLLIGILGTFLMIIILGFYITIYIEKNKMLQNIKTETLYEKDKV
jgi:uncharacterized protein YktA (UPF0223 family)